VRNYRIAKTDTVKHKAKLRWILEQLPLVEAELKESGAAQSWSHMGRGTKRKRNRDDDVTDIEPSKRLRKTQCDGVTKATLRKLYSEAHSVCDSTSTSINIPPWVDRPKGVHGAPKIPCKSMSSSRRLAGQVPEFGLDGQPVDDAKPQIIPRSGKTVIGGGKRLRND
jgi:hypothetical protein